MRCIFNVFSRVPYSIIHHLCRTHGVAGLLTFVERNKGGNKAIIFLQMARKSVDPPWLCWLSDYRGLLFSSQCLSLSNIYPVLDYIRKGKAWSQSDRLNLKLEPCVWVNVCVFVTLVRRIFSDAVDCLVIKLFCFGVLCVYKNFSNTPCL